MIKTLARGAAAGLLALTVVSAAFLATALPARAQPEDGKVYQDWTVRCDPNPSNKAEGGCYLLQSVVNSETKQPVMQIRIGLLKEDHQPVAVITVPLGIRLPPGVTLQIDEQQPTRIAIERCMPEGCVVQFRLSPELVATFKGGVGGKVIFQDPTGRAVPVPFSLKGFTAGLGSLGS